MRGSVWIVTSVMALALGACQPKQAAAPSPAPALPPVAAATPAAPAPAADTAPAAAPTPATAAAAAPPYHFSPGDFPARERRVAALIANAESRDTLGETAGIASEGRYQRSRCTSKACAEHAYVAEEARLRKWEGSEAIK